MSPEPKAMKFLAASARHVRVSEQNVAQTVPSPCMSVCQMDAATGWCQGCFRTLEEIGQWGNADDAFKRVVWARIETRLAQFEET
ncbi:MAG: DUF1289 domain-containing protein [Rhodoferax sp.]|uniref:DUF1289 domain-containing protein n=1 Tax=Rhodoferax sp. TaxID=50421 RepID=UPI003BB4ADFB